jgi:hypothetical protein
MNRIICEPNIYVGHTHLSSVTAGKYHHAIGWLVSHAEVWLFYMHFGVVAMVARYMALQVMHAPQEVPLRYSNM